MNEHPDPRGADEPPARDPLEAGLAAAFGPDSDLPPLAGATVLKAWGASLPQVPRVQLREPTTEPVTPVSLLGSPEMPAGPDRPGSSARLQLHGEISRGGMGAILKCRDVDLGRD